MKETCHLFAWFLPASMLLLLAGGCGRAPVAQSPQSFEADSENSPLPEFLSGTVRDADGPVLGARVREKGRAESALTDAEGHFRLPRSVAESKRVTASKQGYVIGGISIDASPLVVTLGRLPQQDNDEYAWVDPRPDPTRKQNCGNCHGEIYREWERSGHARSATNRRFLNLYEGTDWEGKRNIGWSLLGERPEGSGVCTACHAPTMPLENSDYFDIRKAAGVAARGVHCDYCHKIADVGDGKIGLTHGRFNLNLLRPNEGQLFFGPLDDVDRGEDAFAPLYRDSKYCASCHEGTVFGVHVYSTYSEWLDSPARKEGKQCQTCHTAATGKMTNIAPGNGGIERDPKTLGNHLFFAGSQPDMLRRCLKLSVTAKRDGNAIRADVELRAEDVGHRVPTGFIDRNLVLLVEGFASDGKPVAASEGPVLPPVAGKMLAGKPGRLYAKLLKDDNGRSPAPFWRADSEPVDSRLIPGRPDRLAFMFPANVARLRVRLLFRRFWPEVTERKNWPTDEVTVSDRTTDIQ